jgi:dCTP deaminase
VIVTAFELEWTGCAAFEDLQPSPSPAKVYSNEGLCRVLFFRTDDARKIGKVDRSGDDQRHQETFLPSIQGG